jgi:hypothetical protein
MAVIQAKRRKNSGESWAHGMPHKTKGPAVIAPALVQIIRERSGSLRLLPLAPGPVNSHIAGYTAIQAGGKKVFVVQAHFPCATDLLIDAGWDPLSREEELVDELIILWLLPHRSPPHRGGIRFRERQMD